MKPINLKSYFDKLTKEEKKEIYSTCKKLIFKMFDRQQEFKTNDENAVNNRLFKIYLGAIAEKLFVNYLLENYQINNLEIEGFNQNDADKFDLKINGMSVDIKSSNENKFFNGDYESFCLTKRNFTFPTDQSSKDVIIQIMFNFANNEKTELKEVYCFGGIKKEDLLIDENKRNLKLNNGKFQETYMKSLNCGKLLEELFNIQKLQKEKNYAHKIK